MGCKYEKTLKLSLLAGVLLLLASSASAGTKIVGHVKRQSQGSLPPLPDVNSGEIPVMIIQDPMPSAYQYQYLKARNSLNLNKHGVKNPENVPFEPQLPVGVTESEIRQYQIRPEYPVPSQSGTNGSAGVKNPGSKKQR